MSATDCQYVFFVFDSVSVSGGQCLSLSLSVTYCESPTVSVNVSESISVKQFRKVPTLWVVSLLCESPKGVFAKYIGQYRLCVCLLLCESPKGVFAKYIGQYRLSVCPVCLFFVNDFSQSILVSTVCVCLSVSVCHASYRPQFCTDQDYFFTVDSAYPANFTFFLLKISAKGQGQGHQKPWKQLFES